MQLPTTSETAYYLCFLHDHLSEPFWQYLSVASDHCMVADIQEQKEATFEVAQSPLHNATINLLFEPTTIGYSHSSLLKYKKTEHT